MTLGAGLLAQGIQCCECGGKVRLLHARKMLWRREGKAHVEFETVCTHCGRWDISIRTEEDLPEHEKAFCRKEKLPGI